MPYPSIIFPLREAGWQRRAKNWVPRYQWGSQICPSFSLLPDTPVFDVGDGKLPYAGVLDVWDAEQIYVTHFEMSSRNGVRRNRRGPRSPTDSVLCSHPEEICLARGQTPHRVRRRSRFFVVGRIYIGEAEANLITGYG